MFSIFFFFSSRRRHTRSLCDWSSDVCSSDLAVGDNVVAPHQVLDPGRADLGYVVDGDVDRKSTRLNSSHTVISYAVFCLKKKKKKNDNYNILKKKLGKLTRP